jgi:non-specific serine/threonine protein kinase
MLAAIQEYAAEQLAGSGRLASTRTFHAEHFTVLAEEMGTRFKGADEAATLARLKAEGDNLRSALAWCMSPTGPRELGLRLAAALLPYWQVLGYTSEGWEWLNALLQDRSEVSDVVRARALHAAGVLARERSDLPSSVRCLEEALNLYRAEGDERGIAGVLHALSYRALAESDYADGIRMLEEALVLRRRYGDMAGIAESLGALSSMYGLQNDDRRAAAFLEEAVALRRGLGDDWGLAVALATLGLTLVRIGETARAGELLEEALPLQRSLNNRTGVALSLYALAQIARLEGDLDLAAARCREAIDIWRGLNSLAQLTSAFEEMAEISVAQGTLWKAASLLGFVEAVCDRIGLALPPRYRQVHDRTLAAVRTGMEEAEAAAALATGGYMSLDDAVACAGLDP